MPDMVVQFTDHELSVVRRLADEHDMPDGRIIIQALRLYHLHNERLKAGERCTWSGDAQRAREFMGELTIGER